MNIVQHPSYWESACTDFDEIDTLCIVSSACYPTFFHRSSTYGPSIAFVCFFSLLLTITLRRDCIFIDRRFSGGILSEFTNLTVKLYRKLEGTICLIILFLYNCVYILASKLFAYSDCCVTSVLY